MVGIAVVGVWLLVGLVGIGLTAWMVRRIWKHKSRANAGAWVLALLVSGAATFGAFGTLIGLVKGFGAVGGESIDPSQKARILADSISMAMNCTALAILVWVPSMIVAFVLTRPKKPRSS
jgi:biopolymer transport protein ExbB/TolQ